MITDGEESVRLLPHQGASRTWQMATGKWHVTRGFQTKVARGKSQSVLKMALSEVDDVIVVQSPKLSCDNFLSVTWRYKVDDSVRQTLKILARKYFYNFTIENICIVLRWCIMQTFVFSNSLYRCYVDWFVVRKRHICARAGTHRIVSSARSHVFTFIQSLAHWTSEVVLSNVFGGIFLDQNYSVFAIHPSFPFDIIGYMIQTFRFNLANNFGCKRSI